MKKILIAASVLTTVGLTSTAMAADITMSGHGQFRFNSWSDNATASENANKNSTAFQTALTVEAKKASDSGLTYSVSQTLLTADGADTKSDGQSMKISGDFGAVDFTDGHGYADDFETSADVAADEATTVHKGFDGDSQIFSKAGKANITYLSPKISGLQFSAGYSNAGAASKANATAFGVGYSGGTMKRSFKVKYAGSTAADNGSAGSNKYSASSIGAVLGTEKIDLTLAYNTQKVTPKGGTTANNYKGTGVGLTYKATDSLNLALHRKSASDSKNKKWKYGETAVSGVYTVAPGLTTSLTYTDSKLTDNAGKSNSGKYTRVEVRVAF